MRNIFTSQNVLSYALAFVVIWFGINEILSPSDWVVFAPAFLGTENLAIYAVIAHGILLSICGLLLIFNVYRKLAGIILSLLFIEIIVDLLISSGLSDITVRDIGLLGASIAIALE
jgi:hypothetical protein